LHVGNEVGLEYRSSALILDIERKAEPIDKGYVAIAESELRILKEKAASLTRIVTSTTSNRPFTSVAMRYVSVILEMRSATVSDTTSSTDFQNDLGHHPRESIEDLRDLSQKRLAWDKNLRIVRPLT
jgi:hypothetical protein